MSARLIRATARLAARLRGSWIAVYVETPAELKLSARDRARVVENLRLAHNLGAETLTRSGQRITDELLALAQSRNVTKIVLGKPARPRWKEWLQGSVVNEMARRCGDIDLYVISGFGTDLAARHPTPARQPTPWSGISGALAIVAATALVCWPLAPQVGLANLVMLFLAAVAWVGYHLGHAPALVAAAASVLAFDFFFVPPFLSFAVADARYLITFAVMLGVGVLIASLADRLHRQGEQMRHREERLRALYRLSLELSETPEPQALLGTALRHLEEFYRAPVALITREGPATPAVTAGNAAAFGFDEQEAAVAHWVLDHGAPAGAGTDTLGAARGLYVPLRGLQSTVGVLGIRPADARAFADPEQLRLLEAFAAAIGGALESTRMSEAAGRAEMLLELRTVQAPAGSAPLRLGDCLDETRIVRLAPREPPERVIEALIATLRLQNPTQALQAVLEREKCGTTFIGSGVSIPHARLPGLARVEAALGLSPEGPVRIWALFVAPAESPEMALEFLAGLATFFRAEGNVERLLALETPEQVLAFIRSCGPECERRP
jgi:two-component system sensor histidine kinase KdpD